MIVVVHRLLRLAPTGAAVLALAVIVGNTALAVAGGHGLNHVSGVWLALALDASDGLFYRPVVEAGEYGGTRYFPLLFLLLAVLMRLGLDPIAAGQAGSLLGAGLLATGAYAVLGRLGVGRGLMFSGAVLVLAPYFVQQTVLAIRAEPLAAGFALWGAAAVAERLGRDGFRAWAPAAAVAFTLAVAAKPTSVWAAAAALLALGLAGRFRDASRLALLSLAGWTLLGAFIWIASAGRAIESFRAVALAGQTPWVFLDFEVLLQPVRLLLTSRYLTIVAGLTAIATISAPRDLRRLPVLLMVFAALAAAAALATPGTIMTNQFVEPYVTAALYLVWVAHTRVALRPAAAAVIAGLLVWAASHEAWRLGGIARNEGPTAARAAHAAIAAAVDQCDEPVLAESPLVPILAGRRPVLLDPFAFRVVSLSRPLVGEDLVGRLERREFACVILELDPEVPPGWGWYRHAHLGETVVEAIVRHYRLRETVAGQRFYTPMER